MKLVSRSIALLLFATIALVSCKDDDDDKKSPDNKFIVGDDTYKIKEAIFLKDLGPGKDANDNVYYRNAVIFVTEGIETITVEGETRPSGAGSLVELMLNNEGQELKAGTYTWESEDNEQPFDFWSGNVVLDWNKDSETEFDFVSGTVVVSKSGDMYTITFEGIAEGDANHDGVDDEVTLSGTYEGKLTLGQREF